MSGEITMCILFISLGLTIAFIVSTVSNHRLKSRLIKMGLADKETIKVLSELNGETKLKALKWASLLFFGGLGLILLQFIPNRLDTPLPYGIEAVFVAAGFFVYYILAFKRPDTL